jgi:hypothetical protein
VPNRLPLPVSLDCVPRQDPFLLLIASGHTRLRTSPSPVLPQRFLLPIGFFFSARRLFGLQSPAAGTYQRAFFPSRCSIFPVVVPAPRAVLLQGSCRSSSLCRSCPVVSFFSSAQSSRLFCYFDFASSSYMWNGCR